MPLTDYTQQASSAVQAGIDQDRVANALASKYMYDYPRQDFLTAVSLRDKALSEALSNQVARFNAAMAVRQMKNEEERARSANNRAEEYLNAKKQEIEELKKYNAALESQHASERARQEAENKKRLAMTMALAAVESGMIRPDEIRTRYPELDNTSAMTLEILAKKAAMSAYNQFKLSQSVADDYTALVELGAKKAKYWTQDANGQPVPRPGVRADTANSILSEVNTQMQALKEQISEKLKLLNDPTLFPVRNIVNGRVSFSPSLKSPLVKWAENAIKLESKGWRHHTGNTWIKSDGTTAEIDLLNPSGINGNQAINIIGTTAQPDASASYAELPTSPRASINAPPVSTNVPPVSVGEPIASASYAGLPTPPPASINAPPVSINAPPVSVSEPISSHLPESNFKDQSFVQALGSSKDKQSGLFDEIKDYAGDMVDAYKLIIGAMVSPGYRALGYFAEPDKLKSDIRKLHEFETRPIPGTSINQIEWTTMLLSLLPFLRVARGAGSLVKGVGSGVASAIRGARGVSPEAHKALQAYADELLNKIATGLPKATPRAVPRAVPPVLQPTAVKPMLEGAEDASAIIGARGVSPEAHKALQAYADELLNKIATGLPKATPRAVPPVLQPTAVKPMLEGAEDITGSLSP